MTNATHSGPAGPITYKFEIASSSAFSPRPGHGHRQRRRVADVVHAGHRSAGGNDAVLASDGQRCGQRRLRSDDVAGDIRDELCDRSEEGRVPEQPRRLGLAQTAVLSLVEQDGGGDGPVCMSYTDPGWPDSPWPFGGPDPNFGVYTNQWYFARINGTWYGGAGSGSIAALLPARRDKARKRSAPIPGSVHPSARGSPRSASSSASWSRQWRETVR